MKHLVLILMTGLVLSTFGCESNLGSAGLGAAGGAAAGAGGYEYKLNSEMNRIEEAYKEGRMDREEYEIRKDQIERLSLLQ